MAVARARRLFAVAHAFHQDNQIVVVQIAQASNQFGGSVPDMGFILKPQIHIG